MANRVERIQRNFYWEGVEGQDKFHLVGWEGVCSPIQYGGWGFTKLLLSTKPCWVSGYGDLEWSKSISVERHYQGKVWGISGRLVSNCCEKALW